jgi:hypothetical protein
MKKFITLAMALLVVASTGMYAQTGTQKAAQKAPATQTVTKAAEKPAAQADKVVANKKGPNGETVYQGAQGGQYYMNKSGNKTYLKDVDTIVQGKKGPNGEVVYEGVKGGQYYLNKSGQKIYLSQDKK